LQRAGWKKDAVFEEIYFQQAKSGPPQPDDPPRPRQE
jgi:hypothetical protein